MDSPIIVRYRWSADDMIEAYRYNWRQICRPTIRFGLHCMIAFTMFGSFLALLHYFGILHYAKCRDESPWFPLGLLGVGLYWFFLRGLDFRWTIRRRYAKRPDRDIEMEWEITPETVSSRSCLHRSESRWELFI